MYLDAKLIFFFCSNGYHFDTALLLSIFLGMFGIDRFYLGYPAIGLLKFCTFGFMFLGQLVDVILIATQMVGPADGSAYIISYFGPVLSVIRSDNATYRRPQSDWWDKTSTDNTPLTNHRQYICERQPMPVTIYCEKKKTRTIQFNSHDLFDCTCPPQLVCGQSLSKM